MSSITKPSRLLILSVLLMIIVACGIQPEPVSQKSEQTAADGSHQDWGSEGYSESPTLSAVDLANGDKLKVVATTNIVGDLVRNVAGDNIELTTMLPVGSDPHTFAPAPQDAAAVADADVIFVNGLHLEEFLTELIENAGGKAPVVPLSSHVETRKFTGKDDHANGEGADPHIWLSPVNAIIMVDNIAHALRKLDPANAERYEANATSYQTQLKDLDVWVSSQIEMIPAVYRELVTDHDAFGYYADRYGLNIVGAVIPATTTSAEPSAQELAALQTAITKFETKAIFVSSTVNSVLAEQIAADTGTQLVSLYSGSLGEAGSGIETYLDLIRYNTTAIVAALQ